MLDLGLEQAILPAAWQHWKLPRISLRVGLPDRAVLMLPSAPATWVYIWFVVDALLALNPKELIGEND